MAEPGQTSILKPVVRAVYNTKTNRLVHPTDINLSVPAGQGGEERIVGYENPQKYGINPLDFINLHGIF